MSAQHHPLELDHHLHPEECHVVFAAADRPQHPREQRGNAAIPHIAYTVHRLVDVLNDCYQLVTLSPSASSFSALVSIDHDDLQLLCGDQLLLDVCGRLLPSHRHRDDLLNRQASKVGLPFHRLV